MSCMEDQFYNEIGKILDIWYIRLQKFLNAVQNSPHNTVMEIV